jgi:hypothetical protein
MNIGIELTMVVQTFLAIALTIGILTLLYWVINNPILKDDEMREVLQHSRAMRADALRQSYTLAMRESERLYRCGDHSGRER